MSKRVQLLVGTNKGIFIYSSTIERRKWSMQGPFLPGWEAYSVLGDTRSGSKLYAGTSHAAYGATIRVSAMAVKRGNRLQIVQSTPRRAVFH